MRRIKAVHTRSERLLDCRFDAPHLNHDGALGGVLFGYLFRLALIFLAVWVVKDQSWISVPALGVSIIVTHLGLLFWEMKFVALSLAHPGLKPDRA